MTKKLISMLLAFCLLAGCFGCTAGSTGFFPEAVGADRIIISVHAQPQPEALSPAKICTTADDVQAVVTALQKLPVGKETETVYGGQTAWVIVYKGEELLNCYSFTESTLVLAGTSYRCNALSALQSTYSRLAAAEEQVLLGAIVPAAH